MVKIPQSPESKGEVMNIDKILEEHQKWLDNPETGVRADLREANLQYTNLRVGNRKVEAI